MEVAYFSNEFPKEDLRATLRHLSVLSRDRSYPLLARFIQEATRAVKQEIARLPSKLQRLFGPFETLYSWADDSELREGVLCGAVDGVLLIVVQLSAYLRYIDVRYSRL